MPKQIDLLIEKLRGYSGPYRDASSAKARAEPPIGRERIMDWLCQFTDEEIIDCALDTITRVRLIGRREITGAMRNFIEANPDFRGAFVCPLGEPKDSSAICTYLAGDLQKEYDLQITSLLDALASTEPRPILFVDDFIGSGKQSVTILESMLGEKLSYDLNETRPPLASVLGDALRKRSLGFAFAAGMDEGVNRLREHSERLRLSATVETTIGERELPVAFPEGEHSPRQDKFRAKCIEIGRTLLDDGDERHTSEWINERTLGYGNRGFLVLFPYNTPTQTLTCLWAEGRIRNRYWSPLFPRRKKT